MKKKKMMCYIVVLYFSPCEIFVLYFSACGTRSGILCCIFPCVNTLVFRVVFFCMWNALLLFFNSYFPLVWNYIWFIQTFKRKKTKISSCIFLVVLFVFFCVFFWCCTFRVVFFVLYSSVLYFLCCIFCVIFFVLY